MSDKPIHFSKRTLAHIPSNEVPGHRPCRGKSETLSETINRALYNMGKFAAEKDEEVQNLFTPCEEIHNEACEYAECEGYENELAEVYIRGYMRGYSGGAADQFRKYLKNRKSQRPSKE